MKPISTLVVDDNDDYRTELVEYLHTQEGITIVGEARNGLEAVSMTDVLDPDLILMDVSMPGIGGLEATMRIKEHHARTKVVLVTIHEERTYRMLAEMLQADGFICKSNVLRDVPRVLGKIRATLDGRTVEADRSPGIL